MKKIILIFFVIQVLIFSSNIEFIGETKYSKYLLKEIPEIIDQNNIFDVINDMNNVLKNNGYIFTKVEFVEGNINTQNFIFKIVSKKRGKIKGASHIIFPDSEDINIRDIDQAIENLNLLGYSSVINIEDNGDIVVEKEKIKPKYSIDWKLSDKKNINFNIKSNPFNFNLKVGDVINTNINLSIPYKTYKLNLNYDFTHVSYNISRFNNSDIVFSENKNEINTSIDKNLYRNKSTKVDISLFEKYVNRVAEYSINNKKIELESRKINSFYLGTKLSLKKDDVIGELNYSYNILSNSHLMSLDVNVNKGVYSFNFGGFHSIGNLKYDELYNLKNRAILNKKVNSSIYLNQQLEFNISKLIDLTLAIDTSYSDRFDIGFYTDLDFKFRNVFMKFSYGQNLLNVKDNNFDIKLGLEF